MAHRSFSGGSEVGALAVRECSWKASDFDREVDLHWLQVWVNSSGLLLACGFLGPIGPALIVSVMLVAILTVHKGHGFFAFSNGPELPIIYITGAVAVALAGSGYYSIDHALGLDSSFSEVAVTIILACGVLGALASLAVRHSPELAAKSS